MIQELEYHSCPSCSIYFAAPKEMFVRKRQDGSSFYCPNGHSLSYKDNENNRLRRERDRLKQQIAQKEDYERELREARDRADRQAAAARGQVTKMRKRAGAGVCQCCNRTFLSLQKHMALKHPGFVANAPDDNVYPIKKPA